MHKLIALTVFGLLMTLVRGEYAVKDGDTVVFLGDSITAARQYSKTIETYTLLRFPERKVKFINAGQGGETAHGCLARLDNDVFQQGATVLTVAYGINDIGWGTRADDLHKKEYLDAIGEIVDRCQKHGVRVFICSAAITAEDPDHAENNYLQKMCDEGLTMAKAKGAGTIDVQRSMRDIQRRVWAANTKEPDSKKHTRMHVDDGVHLNDLGQMAMAFAILKGLDAPADVSSATIDAHNAKSQNLSHCTISRIKLQKEGIDFTRTDDQWPLNLNPLWMLYGFHIPISDELNRYLLTVINLEEGKYEIRVNDRLIGTWSSAELSKGINIASATPDPWQPGGPWDAQAHEVKIFTDMRDELAFVRRTMDKTISTHPHLKTLKSHAKKLEEDLTTLQRELAKPIPLNFQVRKLGG
jgi:lysophospholipase L1-like esterase